MLSTVSLVVQVGLRARGGLLVLVGPGRHTEARSHLQDASPYSPCSDS